MQKPSCPQGQGRLCACKNYCFFSVLEAELALDGELLAPDAALPLSLDEAPADGVPLELDALLLGAGALGEVLSEPLALVEPPAAESCFGAADDEELEEDGGVLGLTDAEPDTDEPEDGELGVVVEPAEEDEEPAGGVVRETARSPSVSPQAVSNPAPSARDTATAKVESLM
jgi:hypothetical protein